MLSHLELINVINAFDSKIKAQQTYLERLNTRLKFSKNAYTAAKTALEGGKILVNNNRNREELCPSLMEDKRWQSIVKRGEENEKAALEKCLRWEKIYTETKGLHEKAFTILREYEINREMLLFFKDTEYPKDLALSPEDLAAEKESFMKTEFSLPRPK